MVNRIAAVLVIIAVLGYLFAILQEKRPGLGPEPPNQKPEVETVRKIVAETVAELMETTNGNSSDDKHYPGLGIVAFLNLKANTTKTNAHIIDWAGAEQKNSGQRKP